MKNKTLITHLTRLCLCALLAGVCFSSFGQKKMFIECYNNFENKRVCDTTYEYFRSDTSVIHIIYADSLDIMKYSKAIKVISGYGYEGYFDLENNVQIFIRYKNKWLEINRRRIWKIQTD